MNALEGAIFALKIKESGMTKTFVAEKVDISASTLSRILAGKQSHVSEELKKKLHEYLDKKINENK